MKNIQEYKDMYKNLNTNVTCISSLHRNIIPISYDAANKWSQVRDLDKERKH